MSFIAVVWDVAEESAVAAAQELLRPAGRRWRCAIDTAGFVVLGRAPGAADSLQLFPVGCGVLIGSLFARPGVHPDDAPPARIGLTAWEAQRILAGGGRGLVTDYWGDYVALFREWDSAAIRVVRAPGATLSCLHLTHHGVQLYASDMDALAELTGRCFSIDWHSLARTFLGPPPPGHTHLNEVREVIPGEADRVLAGRLTRTCLWSAAEVSREGTLASFPFAARSLRTVIRACVQARASEFSAIVMALSGGLDSSVTLSCLADAPSRPRVQCLTQFAEGTESDERRYARLAASAASCELLEYPRRMTEDLTAAQHARRFEVSTGLRVPAIDRIEPDAARAIGAGAIFDGNGGDELHCRVQHALCVSDYLHAHGFGSEAPALLLHAAFTEGVTVWQMLARCVRDALFPNRVNVGTLMARDIHGSTLLHRDVIDALIGEHRRRDRFADEAGLPPGRRWQMSLLRARRTMPSPFSQPGDPVRVSPLLSQPVMELALRIPTWFQLRGRRDRALARAAFAQDLPDEILHRQDKGGAESIASSILSANLPFLREMLTDGAVARSGIIDRPRLAAVLDAAPAFDGVSSVPLFDLLGAEIWARAWAAHNQARPNARRIERLYEGRSL